MNPKNKEYLERDYMKLKSIHRQLIMMTIAIKQGEEHYNLVKSTIPSIRQALNIMKQIIEED